MYRHSPVRNQRSKGIKTKHVVQVCLLLAVCFWLIFQVKRSHDKKKEFDNPSISHATDDTLKFGRKDLLQPKLQEATPGIQVHEDTQEQEDEDEQEENKHEEEEQDEDKMEEEKDDGGGDDEIDDNEQDKSIEVDIIDEDRETEEKDAETLTENMADHDEDGSSHEAREEHYKADDASSAVITHDPGNEIKNATSDDNSSENGGNENTSVIQEKESESRPSFHVNTATTSSTGYHNATLQGFSKKSSDESVSENLERYIEDPTHLEEKEVRNDLETLPDIETEGDNSEDTAAE